MIRKLKLVDLMISESHKNNLPDPTVRLYAGGIEMVFSKMTENSKNIQGNGNVTENVGDNVGENVGEGRLKIILGLISKNNKISANQLATQLSVSDRTIERDIDKLKQKSLLQRIGKDKGGHWKLINTD